MEQYVFHPYFIIMVFQTTFTMEYTTVSILYSTHFDFGCVGSSDFLQYSRQKSLAFSLFCCVVYCTVLYGMKLQATTNGENESYCMIGSLHNNILCYQTFIMSYCMGHSA